MHDGVIDSKFREMIKIPSKVKLDILEKDYNVLDEMRTEWELSNKRIMLNLHVLYLTIDAT